MGRSIYTSRGFRPWVRRALLLAASGIVATALYAVAIGTEDSGTAKKLALMKEELSRTQADIAVSAADVRARAQRVDALKNDTTTIENMARSELHMLFPHEKTLLLREEGARTVPARSSALASSMRGVP